MTTPARTIPALLAAPAVLLLAGCSALGVFDDTETDVDDSPAPIAYVDGSATLTLTGGSRTEVELPIQVGSSRQTWGEGTSDTIGFRADPWSVVVSSIWWPGEPDMWTLTVNRLDHGHWLAMSDDACETDVRSTSTTAQGTVTCDSLEWLDALAINLYGSDSQILGEEPFDAQLTFSATLASPAPSLAPVPTLGPGESLAPAERTITASHILYSPNDDPGAAPYLPLTDAAWTTARGQAQAAADDLRAILDPGDVIAAFEERALEGDDSTAQHGGALGAFTRDVMVPEFADPLFDAVDLQRGDILGPVRTEFGWHVILYLGEGDPPTY
jgi:hypothetical protein